MLKKYVFFTTGVIFYITLPVYCSFFVAICLVYFQGLSRALMFICAGLLSFFLHQWVFVKPLPINEVNQWVTLRGVVLKKDLKTHYPQRFIFESQSKNTHRYYSRFRLSLYGREPLVKEGMVLSLKAKLKPFLNYRNEGGKAFKQRMRYQGVVAKGYVKDIKQMGEVEKPFFSRLREQLLQSINLVSMSTEAKAIWQSLSLGFKGDFTPSLYDMFQKTGTGHLVAISGLHIGIIAYCLYYLSLWCWSLSGRACLFIPAQRAASIMAILGGFFYALLTGFSVSARRAAIMLSVFMLGRLANEKNHPLDVFFLSLALVLLINPYSIYSVGFYLSFYAVFIILTSDIEGRFQAVKLQAKMSVFMLPMSLFFFSTASLASLPANLLAIPWVSFILLPLSLLLLLLAQQSWISLVGMTSLYTQCIDGLLSYLRWLSDKKALIVHWSLVRPLEFVSVIVVLFLISMSKRKLVVSCFSLFALLIIFYRPALSEGQVKLTQLDVGQGLATVVKTQNHQLIYDTGIGYRSGFNMGAQAIEPFLRYHRIDKLDKLIVSHDDIDHRGGALYLEKHFPIAEVITNHRSENNHCHAHKPWVWDGVRFEFIYLPYSKRSDNNNSCVLKITTGDNQLLLTGDIEKSAENYLLRADKNQLSATVLAVPHHGSSSSSSEAFISAVSPKLALISAGRYNRFRFPHHTVLGRYRKQGTQIYSTGQCGQIDVTVFPSKAPVVETFIQKC